MYLAEGDDKALLIDTGVGIGSLKKFVTDLTDKEISVLITHGHVDHAMGAGEFDRVYMNHDDEEVYKNHSRMEQRVEYVRSTAEYTPGCEELRNIGPDDFIESKEFSEFLPLEAGMKFELGGITVEVLNGKGHTPGTMIPLIREMGILITGDACNGFTFLFEPTCSTVESYKEMLVNLKKETDGKYDRVLLFHGPGDGEMNLIDGVIEVCDNIMQGDSDEIPFEGIGCKGLIARAMNFRTFSRVDGGVGNVIYRENGIFNN